MRATRRITATTTCRPHSAGLGRCSHNITRRCSPSTAHPCSHRGVCTQPFYGAAARTFHAALLRQVLTHYFPLCLTLKRLRLFSPTPARRTLGDVTDRAVPIVCYVVGHAGGVVCVPVWSKMNVFTFLVC